MYGNDKYPPTISSPLASSVPTVVAASRSHASLPFYCATWDGIMENWT